MKEKTIPPDLAACIAFHGHLCPGVVIGYRAAKHALKKLGAERAADEELLCITMTDSCPVDAIQFLTGCTLGKGNLILRDYGKMVFIFLIRSNTRLVNGIRVSLRQPPEKKKNRTKKDIAMSMLSSADNTLFKTRRLKEYAVPERARIFSSLPCAVCGERTMEPRLTVKDGKLICPECCPEAYTRGW